MKLLYAFLMKLASILGQPVKAQFLKNSKRVRTLILAGDSVLLVRSSVGSQKWSLPGGGIEKNELPQYAAQRELFEETNLKLQLEKFVELGSQKRTIPASRGNYLVTFYLAELPRTLPVKVRRPLEILDCKWHPLNNLPADCSPTVETALNMRQPKAY